MLFLHERLLLYLRTDYDLAASGNFHFRKQYAHSGSDLSNLLLHQGKKRDSSAFASLKDYIAIAHTKRVGN